MKKRKKKTIFVLLNCGRNRKINLFNIYEFERYVLKYKLKLTEIDKFVYLFF